MPAGPLPHPHCRERVSPEDAQLQAQLAGFRVLLCRGGLLGVQELLDLLQLQAQGKPSVGERRLPRPHISSISRMRLATETQQLFAVASASRESVVGPKSKCVLIGPLYVKGSEVSIVQTDIGFCFLYV